MRHRFIYIMLFVFAARATALLAQETTALPPFQSVITTVQQTLNTFEDYQPGDLINRQQAEKLFNSISTLGWEVPHKNPILQRVPDADDPICRYLLSSQGKSFMRKVITLPGGLDRVDNLLQLPDGSQIMKQLVNGKDGEKLIEYMTSSTGGKNLGNMLGKQAKTDFNKPTGKIYTAKVLVMEIEQMYLLNQQHIARSQKK
jgi:hypothetical protein